MTRGNMLAAAFGTAVGNPLSFPVIFAATYHLGSFVLRGDIDVVTDAGTAEAQAVELMEHGLFEGEISPLLPSVGTMILGAIPLSIITFAGFYLAVRLLVVRFRKARQARMARLPA